MYNRVFDWEFLNVAVAGPISWCIFFAKPLYMSFRKPYPPTNAQLDANFFEKMDIKTRNEFVSYCDAHYCMENINFLIEVDYFEKENDPIKQLLLGSIIRTTYLQELGLQPINVSWMERNKALHSAMDTNVFMACKHEIVLMLHSGTWKDFQLFKKKQMKIQFLTPI
jgi:hypothetical protein